MIDASNWASLKKDIVSDVYLDFVRFPMSCLVASDASYQSFCL